MKKITAEILAGKGVVGLADTPGLSKEEMQRKMDEIGKDVLVPAYNELVEELMGEGAAAAIGYAHNANLPGAENVQQAVDQTVEKISEQEKDLKQYVDDTLQAIGAADMQSAVYDPQHKATDIFAYADNAAEAAKEEAEETAKAEAESTIGKMLVLTYGKAGTNHTLSGLSGAAGTLSCVFTASADYAKGDTFTVDGESYTVKQQNGEEAGDKLFAAGAVVSCIIDTAGKTVNFKSGGGGGIKMASGTATGSNNNLTVAGLDFEPTRIEITVTKSPSTTGSSSFYCASYTAGQKMTIVYKGAPGYNTPVVDDVTTDSKYSGVQYAYADGTVTFTSHITSDEYICGFKAVPYRWVAWREE